MSTTPKEAPKRSKKYRWLRIILRILLVLFLLVVAVILFVRSQWGQDIIVSKAVNYVSSKTNTTVAVDKLFITFDGDIMLKGLYLEDQKGDTLVYSRSLEADIPLLPILRGEAIGVEEIDWEGLRANIIRKDSISGFNFQFLADAFAASENQSVVDTTTTSSDPLSIILGEIRLRDIDVVYVDGVTGIDSHFIVDELDLEMQETDLENMRFIASSGRIANSKIDYTQFAIPVDPNAEEIPLPYLEIDELEIENTSGTYATPDAGLDTSFTVGTFKTEAVIADLSTNTIHIKTINLLQSDIKVKLEENNNNSTVKEEIKSESIFPDFTIDIATVIIDETQIDYRVGNTKVQSGFFNPNVLKVSDVGLQMSDLKYTTDGVRFDISEIKGKEASGIYLKKGSGKFAITNKKLTVNALDLLVNKNTIIGDLKLTYPNLATIADDLNNLALNTEISKFAIDLQDVYRFQPDFKNNEIMVALAKAPVQGELYTSGTLENLQISNTRASWRNTRIATSGSIKNTTDPDNLYLNFPNLKVVSTAADLKRLIPQDSLPVVLPEKADLSGSIKGGLASMSTNAVLTTSKGNIKLKGSFKNTDRIAFDVNSTLDNIALAELLQNPQLGDLNAQIIAKGSGSSLNTLDAQIEAVVTSFKLPSYEIKDFKIAGTIDNGTGDFVSQYKDENINFNLEAGVVLDTINTVASLNLDLKGANLQGLGAMQRDVRTGFKLDASFKGNLDRYAVDAEVNDGVVVYDDKTYLIGNLAANAFVNKDSTALKIENKLLQLDLASNADPERFINAIKEHVLSYYYRDAVLLDTIPNPVQVDVKAKISQAPILNEVFLVNVNDLDTITLDVAFNQEKRTLDASVVAPHINYSGNELDSLQFTMNTTREDFQFNLGFNEINAGPIRIDKTEIKGNQVNNELALDFLSYHNDEKLIHIASNITGSRDSLRLSVNPEELIFNKKQWTVPNTNEIFFLNKDKLAFNDFRFKRNNQSVSITDELPNFDKDHIAIDFQNFKLSEFLAYLNPDEKLAKGNLNGDLVVEDPFGDIGFLADLVVNNFEVLNVDMGTLQMNAQALTGNEYAFSMAIDEGAVDLDLLGSYEASEDGATLDMELRLNEFKTLALEGFTQGAITEGTGAMKGTFDLTGKLDALDYKGDLEFANAGFKVTALNTSFLLPDERVSLTKEAILFDNVTIQDANQNKMVVQGKIGTEDYINPTFDLDIKAKQFKALDAKQGDNDFLYGKAIVNADAQIKGDLQIPIIRLDATVDKETSLTYVMPTASVNLEERDGIVIFVNKENPDAILTQSEEESAALTGFDIRTRIKVEKEARVQVIIDEQTGDNFQAYGEGDFDLKIQPNGRMTLTGVYNIAGGSYEMNLYSLVNRKFTIAPSSRVIWSGDPFNAKLDLRAIYDVKTSASSLMAAQLSGSDPSVRTKYRQQLPFLVYLNIDGELLSPKINFALDMPEDEQGSIGGQVYGRIQQVNQQEAELNRQVFSLLVLNRFYPEPGSDGSGGGFASVARDNLNDALSDQLNLFSDKLLGNSGVEVDFGLDSFTDYQGTTPQERTQLDIAAQKKLFDDRLVVRVGSSVDIQGSSTTGESTPVIGNVSLEYLLTEDGKYRLKGFRRSEFENVVDGQTVVSGIALIFTQEFNHFSELWDAILRKEVDEEQSEQKTEEKSIPKESNERIKN